MGKEENLRTDLFVQQYVEYLKELKKKSPNANGTYIVSCPEYKFYFNADLKESMVSLINDKMEGVNL